MTYNVFGGTLYLAQLNSTGDALWLNGCSGDGGAGEPCWRSKQHEHDGDDEEDDWTDDDVPDDDGSDDGDDGDEGVAVQRYDGDADAEHDHVHRGDGGTDHGGPGTVDHRRMSGRLARLNDGPASLQWCWPIRKPSARVTGLRLDRFRLGLLSGLGLG